MVPVDIVSLKEEMRREVVTGSSLGAGRIMITDVDGFAVEVTGALPALICVAHDVPGIVATVTSALARSGENIASMRVSRRQKGGDAIHIYELDSPPSPATLDNVRAIPAIRMIRAIPRIA